MKWEACDLKFPAVTSNMRQCWVMLSDRERAKLSRRQLAKRSIALLETKLNMCKCSKRVASRLLRQAGESRKCHDWTGEILYCFLENSRAIFNETAKGFDEKTFTWSASGRHRDGWREKRGEGSAFTWRWNELLRRPSISNQATPSFWQETGGF